MQRLVRTEVGLVAVFAAAMLAAYIGLAVFISGADPVIGLVVLVASTWLMVSAPILHDRAHRDRGEATHAVWGRGDRRKPDWWNNWKAE